MVNGFRYYRALESISVASALSTAYLFTHIRSESINADSLNSNFLQLGRRSGGRPQRAVHPMRLPVNTVIHTTLVGLEPATFRSLVDCCQWLVLTESLAWQLEIIDIMRHLSYSCPYLSADVAVVLVKKSSSRHLAAFTRTRPGPLKRATERQTVRHVVRTATPLELIRQIVWRGLTRHRSTATVWAETRTTRLGDGLDQHGRWQRLYERLLTTIYTQTSSTSTPIETVRHVVHSMSVSFMDLGLGPY